MNFPAYAYQNYLKNKDRLYHITKSIIKKLRKLSNPIQRAQYAHKQVNNSIEKLLEDPIVKNNITCKRGCAACCHTQVGITSDEAFLLTDLIVKGHPVDTSRLKIQAQIGNNSNEWLKLSYHMRKCVFLRENNECSIYEQRPLVCRTNLVISPPKNCDTSDGINHPVRLVKTEEADMVTIGAFSEAKSSGTLASLVHDTLKARKLI